MISSKDKELEDLINKLQSTHIDPKEAIRLQIKASRYITESPLDTPPATIGGFDLSFPNNARAAAIVIESSTMETIEEVLEDMPVTMPYIPGLLAFREAPVILRAYNSLKAKPDVIMIDGHGRAHPRRFGIACHVGLILRKPSIGVAKSLLIGNAEEPGDNKGDWKPITLGNEVLGAAVRTKPGVKPVYVSVGNMISLEQAVELVLKMTTKYRLPEPTRRAHMLASRYKNTR